MEQEKSQIPEKLIGHVKARYLQESRITNDFSIALPIEESYTQLAIVEEKEQREKEKFALVRKEADDRGEDEKEGDEKDKQKKDFSDSLLPSFEQIYAAKKPIEIVDIFKEPDVKRVLILGRAGIGKSTLCHHLAYQWAKTNLWGDKFSLVVWVPLRNLVRYPENESTVAHVIHKECLVAKKNTGKKPFTLENIENCLENFTGNILYILDGYDEVSRLIDETTPQSELIHFLLDYENVIITSRPYAIDSYMGSKHSKKNVDLRLENIGFSDKSIDEFICRFLKEKKADDPGKLVTLLKAFLQSNASVRGIACIPINLLLICHYWVNRQERQASQSNLPETLTLTELYTSLVADMCIRYLQKFPQKKVDHSWSSAVFQEPLCQPLLDVLRQLAFHQMKMTDLMVPAQQIQILIDTSHEKVTFREIAEFGLLKSSGNDPRDDRRDHYFVHLTFQEFLAAWRIAEKLKEKDKAITLFIQQHKYNPKYEMVWWYVAGLLKPKKDDEISEALEIFFNALESEPRDLGQIYHQMLLMRCMDECQLRVRTERKKSYLSNLFQLIDIGLSEKRFLHDVLKRYLNLSGVVFNQKEIVEKFFGLLNGQDGLELTALSILEDQPNLPEKIMEPIASWFTDLTRWQLGKIAIDFFNKRANVSPAIEKKIAALFVHEFSFMRQGAFEFFSIQSEMSREAEEKIVALLTDESENARLAAIEFFDKRTNVLPAIEEKIAALLTNDGLRKVEDRGEEPSVVSAVIGGVNSFDEEIDAGSLSSEAGWPETKEKALRDRGGSGDSDVPLSLSRVAPPFRDSDAKQAVAKFSDGGDSALFSMMEKIPALLANNESRKVEDRGEEPSVVSAVIGGVINSFDEEIDAGSSSSEAGWPETKEKALRDRGGSGDSGVPLSLLRFAIPPETWRVRCAAIEFFDKRTNVLPAIEEKIAALFTNENDYVKHAAIEFFDKRTNVLPAIEEKIAALFTNENDYVRRAAVRFLGKRANVSPAIEEKIAALLIEERGWDVRQSAVEFFVTREEISAEAFRKVGKILHSGEKDFIDNILYFLSKISISKIVDCICKMDKKKVSPEMLVCLIVKLLLSKIPLYQCGVTCIQVGGDVIEFESEEELAAFTRNFQRIFHEFVGFSDKAYLTAVQRGGNMSGELLPLVLPATSHTQSSEQQAVPVSSPRLTLTKLQSLPEEWKLKAENVRLEKDGGCEVIAGLPDQFTQNVRNIFNGTATAESLEESFHLKDKDENTYSHFVCMSGNIALLNKLIERGTFSTKPNRLGLQPIHIASVFGHSDCVGILMDNGQDDSKKLTPCDVSISAYKNGALSRVNIHCHPIELAVLNGQEEVVELWLAKRPLLFHHRNAAYGNLIHLSILSKRPEMLTFLLKHKECLTLVNEEGGEEKLTPLMLAIEELSYEAMAQLCAKQEVDVNYARSTDANTALHHAVNCTSMLPVFRFLLYFKANLEKENRKNRKPLAVARKRLKKAANSPQQGELEKIEIFLDTKELTVKAKEFVADVKDFQQRRIQNLVFQGGGPKGVLYLGVVDYLEKNKRLQEVERVAGTSAGAITALGVALGYKGEELLSILKDMDMLDFVEGADLERLKKLSGDSGTLSKIVSGILALKNALGIAVRRNHPEGLGITDILRPWNMLKESVSKLTGLSTGNNFLNWIAKSVIQPKIKGIPGYEHHDGMLTFGELADLHRQNKAFKHLFVVTLNVKDSGKNNIVVINSEDPQWKDVLVASAVRASMSIPGIFEPCPLLTKVSGKKDPVPLDDYVCVDGGTLKNCPVEIFDKVRYVYPHHLHGDPEFMVHNPNTFGFRISQSEEDKKTQKEDVTIDGPLKVLKAILSCYAEAESLLAQLLRTREGRTLDLDPCGVGLLDFNLLEDNPFKVQEMIVKAHKACVDSKIGMSPLQGLLPQQEEHSDAKAISKTSSVIGSAVQQRSSTPDKGKEEANAPDAPRKLPGNGGSVANDNNTYNSGSSLAKKQ